MAVDAGAMPYTPLLMTPSELKYEFGAEVQGKMCAVFPLLMREGWPHSPTQIKQKLIRGISLEGVPDVAVAILIPGPPGQAPSRGYMRQERLDQLGRQQWEVEQEALYNLARRPLTIEEMEPSPGANIVMCGGDYLAAERVLDTATMAEVARRLGEPDFVIGIPARGQLMATGMSHFGLGKPHGRAFKLLVEKSFAQAGDIGISPLLYWYMNGQLNTVLEVS